MTPEDAREWAIWIIDHVPDILGCTPDPWPYTSDDLEGGQTVSLAVHRRCVGAREQSITAFAAEILRVGP